MRLFIALQLPKAYAVLTGLQDELKQQGARISYPKEFHLTLKFLGDVDDPAEIQGRLQAIKNGKFEVSLSEVGFFPGPKKPRIVWVGVEPAEPVIKLQQQIDQSLAGLFPRDKRFHPHITIGRIKQGVAGGFRPDFPKIAQKVESFYLLKSDLLPSGPSYSILSEFKLG
jgi:RNA 2',3'-cyclic 3'-phosphodiesterase